MHIAQWRAQGLFNTE